MVPVRTLRVLTTASLAVKPAIRAAAARQSPKPSGARTGAISRPTMARRLSALSLTTLRRTSKVWRNQMTMVATKMTVKAFWMKSRAFSHRRRPTLFAEGKR